MRTEIRISQAIQKDNYYYTKKYIWKVKRDHLTYQF